MATRTMSATISPELELERIIIELDRFGRSPIVRMEGKLLTRQPRVGLASEGIIVTRHLGRSGEAWINEMRDAFAANPRSGEGKSG